MSTKKILSAITTLAVVVMMIAPIAPVGAATADELAKSIADATALLNSLNQQLSTMQSGATVTPVADTTGVTGAACAGITFSRNLTIGSKGNDVKCLQTILNASADTQITATGVGAPGSETTYFGALTKAAVVKYQAKNSISPTSGFVGPLTRAKLNGVAGTTGAGNVVSLPTGCTSTSGYSSTTGQSCATGVVAPVVTLPAGCASTAGFSPTTGQSCGTAVPAASTTPITGEGL
ncbi:MAG: peptidoglycan-binding domain-containing protein, partial [Bdellovibrionota bacterium]